MPETYTPTEIKLHRKSAVLELVYPGGDSQQFTAEYLRVHSPSAEVRGHGRGQEILQTGKRKVNVSKIETVGNYAIKLSFDDGHDTGIYSWEYLYDLAINREKLWRNYLARLRQAKASRDPLPPDTQVITIQPLGDRE
ncbi:MAG: DUF971 domain-containing protein [Pseudohongiellaceae bacterium]